MMYETESNLLPDSVLMAIEVLREQLRRHTDYEHVQLTLDNLRTTQKVQMHVIVKDSR